MKVTRLFLTLLAQSFELGRLLFFSDTQKEAHSHAISRLVSLSSLSPPLPPSLLL